MEPTLNASSDTIVAIATPHGKGAIIILRLSGPDALKIADKVWKGSTLSTAKTHTAHLGFIYDPHSDDSTPLDQALATVFRGPNTFTGEDIVEFGLHGSPLIARRVMEALITAGARTALPGEFSRRAVINGRMSLLNAEATADLIAATSKAAHRMAMSQMRGQVEKDLLEMQNSLLHLASLLELELDFSEEDVEFASRHQLKEIALNVHQHLTSLKNSYRTGQAIKEGIPVAIVGPTNAGKSSLLNTLVSDDRAIVSNIHGTTRDIIEDTLEIDDFLFRFMDTAGLRDTNDPIEKIGITQSHRAIKKAKIILLVTDITSSFPDTLAQDTLTHISEDATFLVILNKADLLDGNTEHLPHTKSVQKYLKQPSDFIIISTKTAEGIDKLKKRLATIMQESQETAGDYIITNLRHYENISKALDAIDILIAQLTPPTPHTASILQKNSPTSYAHYSTTTDILAQTLRQAIAPLEELTGTNLQTPALLQNIFNHFCIGK